VHAGSAERDFDEAPNRLAMFIVLGDWVDANEYSLWNVFVAGGGLQRCCWGARGTLPLKIPCWMTSLFRSNEIEYRAA
jgi:hypothetical protein